MKWDKDSPNDHIRISLLEEIKSNLELMDVMINTANNLYKDGNSALANRRLQMLAWIKWLEGEE
jgi:hypothetical protein